jgi:Late competence development protein ComFB.
MDIHNISEDSVITAVEEMFEAVKTRGNPEKLCLCDQCKLDTVCYSLNRVEPRYIVSNRGLTRVEREGSERHQAHADIAALVYKGLQQVNHNLRPTASHDGTSIDIVRKLSFDIPTIDKSFLDEQIRNQIKKIRDSESKELNDAYDAVTKQVLERGLEWD